LVQGDVTDADLVSKLVAESDVVVHFAVETHHDNALANPESFLHSNVIGTLTLLEAVRHSGRLHHVLTDEVYGGLALDGPQRFSESTPYNPCRVRTRRPRPPPTCWCAPSVSAQRFRIVPTTTGPTSM
jgi:dTDP-glucose 4,6-dehydratase